jgi:hypothetical protein
MKSVSDILAERAKTIRALYDDLLAHSSVYQWNPRGSNIVSVAGDQAWTALDGEGQRAQSRLLREAETYSHLVRALSHGQPTKAVSALEQTEKTLDRLFHQSGSTWLKNCDQARIEAHKAIDTQLELIAGLYDPSEGTPVFVPDTNALYHHPDLDAWRFRGASPFVLLLLSNVLAELDEAKVNHRNPDVRTKAEGLIGRMKSYRSRGDIFEGVPLAKGKSTLKTSAVEPRMEDSLPWLDPGNRDDRIVASLVEATRAHPRSPVVLVTRDVNLQNKTAFAGLPFVEPPDPNPREVAAPRDRVSVPKGSGA